jgi:hypothetical protein
MPGKANNNESTNINLFISLPSLKLKIPTSSYDNRSKRKLGIMAAIIFTVPPLKIKKLLTIFFNIISAAQPSIDKKPLPVSILPLPLQYRQ